MIKGLQTLLATAITLAGISASFATAPVLNDLPDVTIGEVEDNFGTDNNFLVFTNAFMFDTYVSDAETTVDSDLKWSFDEEDTAHIVGDTDATWFAVNGLAPIHNTDAGWAADGSTGAPHANPGPANELRAVSDGATFRDIIFTPLAGSAPFPGPSNGAQQTRHATGKIVRFFVSDGFNVVSNDILVKSVADNVTPDSISPTSIFTLLNNNNFTSNQETWGQMSLYNSTLAYNGAAGGVAPSDTQGELRVTFAANASDYRIGGWWTRDGSGNSTAYSVPWSTVTDANYMRGKFFLYAGGQTSPSADNNNPAFRLRLTQRNAWVQFYEVAPNSSDVFTNGYARDLRVSEEPTRPSLYRVDFDPTDVAAAQTRDIDRGFEVLASQSPGGGAEQNGFLALTQSSVYLYPKLVDNTPVKSYLAASNDFVGAVAAGATSLSRWVRNSGQFGANIQQATANSITGITVSSSLSTGLTVDMTTLNNNSEIGVAASVWTNGNAADQGNLAGRIKIGADQLYKIKFHMTSTIPANTQSIIGLRIRSLNFQYNNALQIGPSAAGGSITAICSQASPGTGNALPLADRKPADTTGGWYTVMFHSPISKQIRPETANAGQSALARMPGIAALDDEGENTGSANRRRDVILDTYAYRGWNNTATGTADNLLFSIDEAQVYRYNALADGDENYGN